MHRENFVSASKTLCCSPMQPKIPDPCRDLADVFLINHEKGEGPKGD
jgi:hypothetical protein